MYRVFCFVLVVVLFLVFFTDMHKYFHEPSVVYVTINGNVCQRRHTYVCISLPHACMETCHRGRRCSITAGQPEILPISSHSTSLRQAASEGQTLSTSTDPLVPNKLSDVSFLNVRKARGLLYSTCLTLNLN